MPIPMKFEQFADSTLPTINQGTGQAVIRIRPDVYGFVAYLASITRRNVTEVVDAALRNAFNHMDYKSADVYDICFKYDDKEETKND